MINHISIKNFAIIEDAEVDFQDGLNIITGETGSGKSIVIEAISLVLGSRADNSCIRTGFDKAKVQLLCQLDGEDIVITREISSTGKNLCKLNGELVTLGELNLVSKKIADIHGQYDNQSLLNPDYHIVLLDKYKKEEIAPAKEAVFALYRKFSQTKTKLSNLLMAEKENRRKEDFLKFEIDEINKANLILGEDQALEERLEILKNSEKIFEHTQKSYSLLSEEGSSVLANLSLISNALKEISPYSSLLNEHYLQIQDIYYRLEDLSQELRTMKDEISFSPTELDMDIARLDLIDQLKRKYGNSIEEILGYKKEIATQLYNIQNNQKERTKLEKELITDKGNLAAACQILTSIRREVASQLEASLQKQLRDLNFQESKIKISITPLSTPTETGMDKVEILISTNKGEKLKALHKVASGGEMSRIMLAFKNIISSYDMIPTLIFDEIDNGISGVTASIVGKKLKEIAKEHQIICITHLPQIAAAGHHNYRIEKHSDDKNTYTDIVSLSKDEKVLEIARLLGGTKISEVAISNAKELIATS